MIVKPKKKGLSKFLGVPPAIPKVDTSNWHKVHFSREDVEDAIEDIHSGSGDIEALDKAFNWMATPQGHTFWASLYYGERPPTPEHIAYLEYLLDDS